MRITSSFRKMDRDERRGDPTKRTDSITHRQSGEMDL
jgi:hypothetical protein